MAILTAPTTWITPARDSAGELILERELGVSSLLACVLLARGYRDPGAADRYLHPNLSHLSDPRLLPDFDKACVAILGARERKETIFIHGDYDVDGVTSAALLTRFLKSLGCSVITHVPHRMKEGYGIHLNAVDAAQEAGAKLFLTCDCGSTAHTQVARARAAGMAVVVTDHHLMNEDLPKADAVVNPHRSDSEYPFRELCGVGVVFRLCEGITAEMGHNVANFQRAFLDLAAIGTVADVMPLVGENRVITKCGLERIPDTKKLGLQALLREAGLDTKSNLTSRDIGFVIGPRLNASGRIDDAARSLDLLIETDEFAAAKIAHEIEQLNQERKKAMEEMVQRAVDVVLEKNLQTRNVIVIGGEEWHPGLIGLAAGRIVEKFRRPAIVMSYNPETGLSKASARSIPGFHLGDSLAALGSLVSGGGHAMAAGFSTSAPVQVVADAFEAYGATVLTAEHFEIKLEAEAEIDASELNMGSVESLQLLEPCGNSNEFPTFLVRNLTLLSATPTKNPSHAQLILEGNGLSKAKGIAFNIGEAMCELEPGTKLDVAVKPTIDEWRGNTKLNLEVKHFQVQSETT